VFVFGQTYGRQLIVRPGTTGVNVGFLVTDTNGNFYGVYSSRQIPIGQWTHLAGAWNGTNLVLYLNGVLDRSATLSLPTIGNSGCPFSIGGMSSSCGYSGQYFPGQLDEVSLYDRALLAGEINSIYLAGVAGECQTLPGCATFPTNAVASWPGEGDASDMFNLNPGALQNGVAFDHGMVARAFSFNGSQQGVEIPSSSTLLTTPFSVEAWVKPASRASGSLGQAFIYGQNYGRQLVVRNGFQGLRVAFIIATSRTTFYEVDSSGDIPIGEWTHLVGTYDGSVLSLYINGALDQRATVNITPWDSGCSFHIGGIYDPSGGCAYTGQYFNGLIDEVTCYNAALAASDVQALYNAGEMGKCNSLGYWLQYYFGTNCWSQTYATATTDADGDGVSNFQHYLDGTDPNKITFSTSVNDEYVTSTSVPVQLSILGGVPFYYAVLLNDTDTTHADWHLYSDPSLNVTLGPADGTYSVWVGLKGLPDDAQQTWDGLDITLDRAGPVLAVTNPVLTSAAATVAKSYLQLGGSANEPLGAITYDLVNAAGTVANVDGFVIDQAFDSSRFDYTTTWFQCFDIPLTPGPNSIALHATDRAGNVTTTNITVTLDYSGSTSPEVSVTWPPSGTPLSGSTFYVRGRVSDETASVTAQVVDAANNTTVVDGTVERNGVFWVENLPLAAGTSTVTLTVTNAAGNVTATSLTVTASDVTLTINTTPSDESLYQATGYVNGYISDPSYAVVVNGKPVSVDQSGGWWANDVPIRGQGTATFDAVATGRTTVATSAKPEMPPYVATVEYHDNKHANSSYSGPPIGSSAYSRVKDFTASYQADPSGTWTSTYHGVATDHNSYSPTGGWDNWVFDWSNTGSFTHETASGDPGIDLTWDWIDDQYNHLGQVTGLPDYDLNEAAPGGPAATRVSHYYASGVHYKWPQPQPAPPSTADVAVCARTRQRLFTGGKSSVGRQNLIHLNAWAEQYGQPILGPWQHTPYQLVDTRKIQMLGHSLGTPNPDGTGDLYLVLPDNASKELNLRIPGVKHYNAVVRSVTKHTASVQCVVQGSPCLLLPNEVRPEAHYCVGQKLVFQLVLDPPLPDGVLITNENHWVLPPKYVNAYEWFRSSIPALTNSDGDYFITMCHPDLQVWTSPGYGIDLPACTRYQQQDWPLFQPETGAWWISGGIKLVSCYPTLTLNTGQKASLTVRGQFNVYRPGGGAVVTFPGQVGLESPVYLEDRLVDFDGHVQSDYPGEANWTQLVNRDCQQAFYIETGTWGHFWLDTSLFYNVDSTQVGPGIDLPVPLADSPDVVIDIHVSNIDAFKTYLRFRPTGSDSIWVTLGREEWGWHGTAYVGLLTDDHGITAPQYTPTDEFPEWSSVFVSAEH
jgi:hypothetical protein